MKVVCPKCKKVVEINIGLALSAIKSPAKAKASRENGKKGGRPKKDKNANK